MQHIPEGEFAMFKSLSGVTTGCCYIFQLWRQHGALCFRRAGAGTLRTLQQKSTNSPDLDGHSGKPTTRYIQHRQSTLTAQRLVIHKCIKQLISLHQMYTQEAHSRLKDCESIRHYPSAANHVSSIQFNTQKISPPASSHIYNYTVSTIVYHTQTEGPLKR